jgi:hypothetical protein
MFLRQAKSGYLAQGSFEELDLSWYAKQFGIQCPSGLFYDSRNNIITCQDVFDEAISQHPDDVQNAMGAMLGYPPQCVGDHLGDDVYFHTISLIPSKNLQELTDIDSKRLDVTTFSCSNPTKAYQWLNDMAHRYQAVSNEFDLGTIHAEIVHRLV